MYNFSENQVIRNVRTKFEMVHSHKTTGNTGDIIPIYRKEILPGDYVKMECNAMIKMTTPSFQTMDTAFCDIHWYFVPRRLLWEHWKAFQGEKTVGPHETQPQYTIPQTTAPTGGWGENTLADYFGFPTKVEGVKVDSAYARAYCLIWNEWYRDQNRQDFTAFDMGDANTAGSNGSNYVTDPIGYGKPLKAAKIHDYFTSTLLQPQAGDPVKLPLGTSAPIISNSAFSLKSDVSKNPVFITNGETSVAPNGYSNINLYNAGSGTIESREQLVYNNGLSVDLSNATAATVNQLRMAFALQKIFEANNRSGSRYIEILKNRWAVTPSDATLQRPEFLGGKRFPLNMMMVVQTSNTNTESPLGAISGFSSTRYDDTYFAKTFEEHGILMGLAMIRHNRTYQQGLDKMFSRQTMEDFYMPEFQNIGEQPVYNKEIYFSGNEKKDNEVFGYNEYGAEYRFTPNRVSGQFRSNATNSFDNWHYADDYSETPVNGEDWIVENGKSVDRTLTVTSEKANQFYFDFSFKETNIRTMPPHSIPGFIDHH